MNIICVLFRFYKRFYVRIKQRPYLMSLEEDSLKSNKIIFYSLKVAGWSHLFVFKESFPMLKVMVKARYLAEAFTQGNLQSLPAVADASVMLNVLISIPNSTTLKSSA